MRLPADLARGVEEYQRRMQELYPTASRTDALVAVVKAGLEAVNK